MVSAPTLIVDAVAGLASAGGAPGDGPDPGDQLAEAERLDDVVVGAELQEHDAIDLLTAGADHDDRHRAARAQLPADHLAVEVGEPEVEQDEIGRVGAERVGAGGDHDDVVALAGQALPQRLGDPRIVLDHEHPHPQMLTAAMLDRTPLAKPLPTAGDSASGAHPYRPSHDEETSRTPHRADHGGRHRRRDRRRRVRRGRQHRHPRRLRPTISSAHWLPPATWCRRPAPRRHRSRPCRQRRPPRPPRRTSSTSPARSPSIRRATPSWSARSAPIPAGPGRRAPSDATHVELTFTDGVRSLVFTATRAADGSIDASVDETTVGHGVGRDRAVLARRIRRPQPTTTSTKDVTTMTDPRTHDDTTADAQRARVEALRQRRAPRVDSATTPAVADRSSSAPGATSACRQSVTRGRRRAQRGDDARPRRCHGPRPADGRGDAERPGRHHRRAAASADGRPSTRGADVARRGGRRAARGADGSPERPGDEPHDRRPDRA